MQPDVGAVAESVTQAEHVERKDPAGEPSAALEVRLHDVVAVEAHDLDRLEVLVQQHLQRPWLEQVDVEGVLEIGRCVGGDHEHHPVVGEHPGQFGHVGLRIDEVFDQVRRAHGVERTGPDRQPCPVGTQRGQPAGVVRRGGGGDVVVDADDLPAGATQRCRAVTDAAPEIEQAAGTEPYAHLAVAGLVERQQPGRRATLEGTLTGQPHRERDLEASMPVACQAVMPDTEPVVPLARRALALGIGRIHVLAWRDLDDAEAGGSEVHAEHVLQRWATAGLEVTLRTSAAPGQPGRIRRGGLDVVRRGGRMGVFPRAVAAELAGRHGRRDALVEIWNGVPWGSPVWCRGPRVTWLHHVHGPMWELMLGRAAGRVGEFVERRVAPPLYRRTPVVTLSEASRAELVGHLGFRTERVHVVPPGIAPRFQGPASPAAHPLVVAVGRLAPVKRFDALVRALAPSAERFDGFELVIVGEGEERARIEATIDELGAWRWVRLAGRLTDDELVGLYRRAWLVTSASLAEGWGMTITEAAACGVPAVVTDVGGHRDAVEAGVTGELAPLEQLGAVVAAVLADPARRRRLAAAAQERAARFTWDATAATTLAVLVDEAVRVRTPRRPGATPR